MSNTDESQKLTVDTFERIPTYFVPNIGRMEDEFIYYYMQGSGCAVYFTTEEIRFLFLETPPRTREEGQSREDKCNLEEPAKEVQVFRIDFRFLHANKGVKPEGRGEMSGKVNYFKGNDPSKWHTNISVFDKVVYPDLWPGIDLVFRGENGQIKYEFVVHSGAKVEDIQFTYDGAKNIDLDEEGNLLIDTLLGQMRDERPVSYQEKDGQQVYLESSFQLLQNGKGEDVIHFKIANDYDSRYPLIIDPGLIYSTYLGGTSGDSGASIAVDALGNAYVTGSTSSLNFPTTPGSFDISLNGSSDAFVTKFSQDGTTLIYSTYLGGTNSDSGAGIAVDTLGNAYVTGGTTSSNFPTTPGAFDTSLSGSSNAFVTKLNSTGSMLVYSTYLGGGGSFGLAERGTSIDVDPIGNAYVAGVTPSNMFPTTLGAFQTVYGGSVFDAFVTKFNPTGSALVYSTYLGGTGGDEGNGIAVDAAGNAYVTGETTSPNFPTTPGAFDTTFNGSFDAFVTKLNPAGSALVYSTFLGGTELDEGNGIALDSDGNAYVTGFTNSPNFPTTPGAFDTSLSGSDAFVTKLNSAGSALIYSTYLGGSGGERGNSIAVDAEGNTYVTGLTSSTDFPTENPFQPALAGLNDAFVTKLSPDGSSLIYSSYLGGGGLDNGRGIVVDALGNAYVTGGTDSPRARPIDLTIGDFNNDEILDLAVVNQETDDVSILLGNGDGTFQAAMNFGVGNEPTGITTGDFNGNGNLDLAVTNQFSDNVSILLGNGDGTFQAAMNFGVGSSPTGITAEDFNGNGNLDLAVANQGSDDVSILLGNGDGTFQAPMNFGVGSGPRGITTGDFNGNGVLDLAVANQSSNNVSILLGNGDGTFQAPMNFGVGSGPRGITTGDFNGNGVLDLAVTNQSSNNVSILLGNGDGTFQAPMNFGVGSGPRGITTGDFNGNGNLDLAVTNQFTENVSVLLGNGDGTFQAAMNFGVGDIPVAITTEDFNSDLNLDLAVVNLGSSSVSILQGNGDGSFQTANNFSVGVPFPTVNAFQSTFGGGGGDAFVTKIGLICPDDITVNNDDGQCGAIVSFSSPLGAICTPASGAFFQVGTTEVICTEGNQSCSFFITVLDNEPPTITCPDNITVRSDPRRNGAIVNYASPTVTDNCPGVTFSCTPASGSFFPIGETLVTCTATDASGNTAECKFIVRVIADPCRLLS
ncbi:SBBP repeat-containing protein [Gracilibacillus sp. YIM 98692]|uniref:DUF7948 domain-containing protein n=1 Tax=Gracilibacillus sp. YIM 98692 TaxID=2663532 RepID=UPI0013D5363E|nr:SBBP repeat-containing protein [Gracilibacillus sp. YIM 98692]